MSGNHIENEIHKKWCEEHFQKKHREARRRVELYVQELNCRYLEKSGNEFIRYMESRMKTPQSIMGKLKGKGLSPDFYTAVTRLNDISGVRVVCYCLEEVYWIVRELRKEEKYTVLKEKDYIRKPKKNGYESYHVVLEVPVKLDKILEIVRVELQIRTIIMDAWAGMDNRISYKKISISEERKKQICKYAQIGRRLDGLIQKTLDEAKNEC